MSIDVFNSEKYLDIEANRLRGRVEHFSMINGYRLGLIARSIPHTKYGDLVSVYGYPDQIEKGAVSSGVQDIEKVLGKLAEDARERDLVSGYIRLGLEGNSIIPSFSESGYISLRTKVGDVVAVDLSKSSQILISEYRKKLRYDLRKSVQLTIERSEDFTAFHRIYSENMSRVGAESHYLFDQKYLTALGSIKGVELWLASDDTDVVAGGLFIQQGSNIYYHLGATADRALPVSPLKQLLHDRISNLSQSGLSYLILGGGLGGDDDALMRFKRGFSQLTLPVHALRVIFDTEVYAKLSRQSLSTIDETGFFPAYRIS